MTGVNLQNMNETNKFLLLKTIIMQGPISRIELSKQTGLSKMTVTTLISEYIEKGIVRECGTTQSTVGRKPVLLEAVADSLLTLAVYLGRDFLMVGIVDLKGKVRLSEHVSMSRITTSGAVLSNVLRLCDSTIARTDRSKIWGIGISSIGPIDMHAGLIVDPPDFNNITNVPIVETLRKTYGWPVYLGNDMCVSALAELYFGKAASYNSFFYLGISSGIGGGVVVDHKLYTGKRGLAGSIGHCVAEPNGLECGCGNRGCFELYSSTRAAVLWAKEHGASEDLTWLGLLDTAKRGDSICLQALERMYFYIETVMCNVVSLLDVECIVIGGDIWFGEEFFIERLGRSLRKKMFAKDIGSAVSVELAAYPGDDAFIGAAALVLENNLDGESKPV